MSDPEVIRNSSPHQVSVSANSKVAGGKKVGAGEASVRKTLVGEEPPAPPQEAPELKLSPRIAPAKPEAAPDLPPPVQSHAAQAGVPLPPVTDPASAASEQVLFETRRIQDDIQSADGVPSNQAPSTRSTSDLPAASAAEQAGQAPVVAPAAASAGSARVAVPESLSEPQTPDTDRAAPVIDRKSQDERVALPEGLAAGNATQAQAPVRERVEASQRASVPPAQAAENASDMGDAPAKLRSEQDHRVALPDSENAAALEATQPAALERQQSDKRAVVPESLNSDSMAEVPQAKATAPNDTQGPLIPQREDEVMAQVPPEQVRQADAASGPDISRAEIDNRATLPPGMAASAGAEGPLVPRAERDTLVALPEDAANAQPAEGPLVTRSENDHLVAVPEGDPRLVSDPTMPPPAGERAAHAVPAAATQPVEIIEVPDPVVRPKPAPQTPTPAAPAAVATQPAEEPTMAQMNFPARVVKLKIANDKVRVQLDVLEAPERPARK